MKRFFWNIRFALLMVRHAWMPLRQSWELAVGSDDAYNDDMTPREAYDCEISYWEE